MHVTIALLQRERDDARKLAAEAELTKKLEQELSHKNTMLE